MATWLTHLRVAEKVSDQLNITDRSLFLLEVLRRIQICFRTYRIGVPMPIKQLVMLMGFIQNIFQASFTPKIRILDLFFIGDTASSMSLWQCSKLEPHSGQFISQTSFVATKITANSVSNCFSMVRPAPTIKAVISSGVSG
jgi:hypothetical protein